MLMVVVQNDREVVEVILLSLNWLQCKCLCGYKLTVGALYWKHYIPTVQAYRENGLIFWRGLV